MSNARFAGALVYASALAFTIGISNKAWAGPIGPGFDLFKTPPGGAFLEVPGGMMIPMMGKGIQGSDTDTIVERKAGLPAGGTGDFPIELVALSLQSVAPVDFGGSFFDVFVTLDAVGFSDLPQPDMLPPSLGMMMITSHSDPTGGTFDSFFDVFADVILRDVTTGAEMSFPAPMVRITSQDTRWEHTSLGSFGDWPTGGFSVPGGIVHTGPHPQIVPSDTPPTRPIPEPDVLLLLGSGLAALLGSSVVRRRRR